MGAVKVRTTKSSDGPHQEHDADGSLGTEGAFRDGKQVGFWKRYDRNGQLFDEGRYEAGRKVGEWKVLDPRGVLNLRKVHGAKR
jgi:antitoxin component YwqK of YwqJK toxin-antitoxin module